MTRSHPGRGRRFSLPDLADDRGDDVIEALLSGPEQGRGRSRDSILPRPGDPAAILDNRLDWNAALARESARIARYRRPAAVVVLSAEPRTAAESTDGWIARLAPPIAHVIRRNSRATDLVTRVATARFQLLLPETTEAHAANLARRLVADCEVWLRAVGAPVVMRAAVAGASRDASLEDALVKANESLDAQA